MDCFGAGVAMGYGVALFDKAQVPQSRRVGQTSEGILPLSQKSLILTAGTHCFRSRVICCALQSLPDAISDNLKKPLLRQRTNISMSKGVVPKAVIQCGPWEPLSVRLV